MSGPPFSGKQAEGGKQEACIPRCYSGVFSSSELENGFYFRLA